MSASVAGQTDEAAAGTKPPGGRPKVVYLMGTARNGSTILGVALGNCEGVFYAGELRGWLEKSGVPTLKGDERARFWSAVREQVDGADLYGKTAGAQIERAPAAFRLRRRRALRDRYRRVTKQLYGAIARTAQASYVVDSSSYPLRARELQRIAGIELFLVYVLRDPQSVVASFTGAEWRFSRSQLRTNAYLWLTNLLAVSVFYRQPPERRLVLRYEDLVAQPGAVMRALLDALSSSAELPDFGSLELGVPFQGNRLLRTQGPVALRRGAEIPARRSRLTAAMQLPWRVFAARLRPAARA